MGSYRSTDEPLPIFWTESHCTTCSTRISCKTTRIDLDFYVDDNVLKAHIVCPVCATPQVVSFPVYVVKER